MIANHLYSVSNYATSVFKDRLLPTLSHLNYRIILIVTVALGCLTLCYTRFVKRRVVSFDGTIREGIVFLNKLNGRGMKIFPNEKIFLNEKIGKIKIMKGKFKNDELQGWGELRSPSPNETIYWGYFKDGQLIGDITARYSSGMIKHGKFEKGKLREGKITFPNGTSVVNIFPDVELD